MPLNPLIENLTKKRMLRSFKHFSDKGRGVSPCLFYPASTSAGVQIVKRNIYHDVMESQVAKSGELIVHGIPTYCYIDQTVPLKTVLRLGLAYKEGDTLPIICYLAVTNGILPENNSLIILANSEGLISGRYSVTQIKSYGITNILLYVCTIVPYRNSHISL